jgi:hypothetical protein
VITLKVKYVALQKNKQFLLFILLASQIAFSQNVPIQFEQDFLLREYQLLNKLPNAGSLSIRPFMGRRPTDSLQTDSIFRHFDPRPLQQEFMPGQLFAHPFRLESQFNSKRPFGWNNGSFIQASGTQFRMSTGLLYKSDFFEASFLPEFIMADNVPYKTTPGFGMTSKNNYSKFFYGNSYARFNAGPVTAGFSNENLWWGPGQFSSLIFSNNAPGFGHLHLSTRRPIKTPIFNIEFQFIAAGVDQDSTLGSESNLLRPGPFTRRWRYLNGFAFVISPKPLPGLHLGLTRAMQFYRNALLPQDDVPFLDRYLPAVTALFGKFNPQADAIGMDDGRDQQASVFLRFVLPKEHFEFYFEYGYNDYKDNLRDLTIDAQHSAAYIVGFKKLAPLAKKNSYLSIAVEATQTAQSSDYLTRNAGNWYVHSRVLQGFTHMNQILGAGSGLGNNVQTIRLEHVDGISRTGIRVDRIQNNPRRIVGGYTTAFLGPIQWNDMSIGIFKQHATKYFTVRGEVAYIHSTNYGWEYGKLDNIFASLNFIYNW